MNIESKHTITTDDKSAKITVEGPTAWLEVAYPPDGWDAGDLIELIEILTKAKDLMDEEAPAKRLPRIWDSEDLDEPTGVKKVRDGAGDLWYRVQDGWNTDGMDTDGSPWNWLVHNWGPLTEVLG
jgi:hypothetical protein